MADGSPLGDALAATFGHDVNRPGLNAFVAQSQARNGLVSQQTEEAMLNAQMMRDKMDAASNVEGAMTDITGDPKFGRLAGLHARMNPTGNWEDLVKSANLARLSNTDNMNTNVDVASQAGFEGKAPGPVAMPANAYLPAGVTAPTMIQSPEGAAQVGLESAQARNQNSEAHLRDIQAAAGGYNPNTGGVNRRLDPVMAAEAAEFIRQNPNLATNFRSLLSNGGPDVMHAFLHPTGGVPPSPTGIMPAPGVDLKDQADIRKDFSSGLGARQATSLNTMVQHSQLFDALADQMGNGNFAPTNYINQLWQKTFGSPAPSNLQTAAGFLGNEAVRATVNSGAGTGEERELKINPNSSPDQLHGAAATLRSLAQGQLNSLDLRARRGGVDIAQLLGPEAQAVFGRHPMLSGGPLTAPSAPGSTPASLPSYGSEQEALAAGHKAGDRVIIGGVAGTLQ